MDDDYDDFPNIGGTGSLHDLNYEPAPGRLAGMHSVAQQNVRLVDRQPRPRRTVGFYIPRRK
jgi:hypothetical protein